MAALDQVQDHVEAVKLPEVVSSGKHRGSEDEEVDETSTDGGGMLSGIPSCAASESGDDLQVSSSAPDSKTQSEDEEDEEDEDDDDEDDDDEDDDDEEEETEAERAARIEALKAGPLPSAGSAGHFTGDCSRCCFFPKGRCTNGEDCEFCHFDHEKRIRKKKKKPKKVKRAAKRAEAAAAAAAARAAAAAVAVAGVSESSWIGSSCWTSLEGGFRGQAGQNEAQQQIHDKCSTDGAFSRRQLRARGAQVLENLGSFAGAPLWYHADMVAPALPPPHAVVFPTHPGGAVQAFLPATQMMPPVAAADLAVPPPPAAASAPAASEEKKKKEFPTEALSHAPEKVNVEIAENIPQIPFRPVPVKVTIPVSESVTPIPPRPVPVKVRVSEPGPAPSPLCLELLAKLGELQQYAKGDAEKAVSEGPAEATPEPIPAC